MEIHDIDRLRNLRGLLAIAYDIAYLTREFIADGTEREHNSERTENGESAWNLDQVCSCLTTAIAYLDQAIDPAWRDHLPEDPTA